MRFPHTQMKPIENKCRTTIYEPTSTWITLLYIKSLPSLNDIVHQTSWAPDEVTCNVMLRADLSDIFSGWRRRVIIHQTPPMIDHGNNLLPVPCNCYDQGDKFDSMKQGGSRATLVCSPWSWCSQCKHLIFPGTRCTIIWGSGRHLPIAKRQVLRSRYYCRNRFQVWAWTHGRNWGGEKSFKLDPGGP